MKKLARKEAAGVISVLPIRGIPEIQPKNDLAEMMVAVLSPSQVFRQGDILALKHKIVAKAEGRVVALDSVNPSREASAIAERNHSDPRVIQLALREARHVVRNEHVLITETQQGFVCANSGVDVSNVDGGTSAVLLPVDADSSAARIHKRLKQLTGLHIPVIVCDSFGRAWREGLCDVAIGVAGMRVIRDLRGCTDDYGYELHVTEEAVVDELAAMAGLISGKSQRIPACIIRGYTYERGAGTARQLVRSREMDLFR